jgi:LacI family transcriptional regulator
MNVFFKTIPRVLVALSPVQQAQRCRLAGILRYARLHGPWDVQLLDNRPFIAGLDHAFKSWRPDGLIVRGFTDDIAARVPCFEKVPAVLLDAAVPSPRHSSVDLDTRLFSETVADYYLGLGLTAFAYAGAVLGSRWSDERGEAFAARLRERGHACHSYAPRFASDWGREQRALAKWLRALPKPCGLFAAFDQQAKLVLDTCLFAGIRVPDELAVIGVDNDEILCENAVPTLSSLQPDFEGGGEKAAELLDRLMRRRGRPPAPPVHLTYGIRGLVHRQSSQHLGASSALAAAALEFIRLNACAGIQVPDIVAALHTSRSVLEKDFRRATGHSLHEEIQNRRLERVSLFLRETDLPVGEIGARCGYPAEPHLIRLFRKRFGLTPAGYRRSADRM